MPHYDPAGGNSGGSQPGTLALREFIKKTWPQVNVGYPFGIYANRPPSEHAEGRALDIGLNANNAEHRRIAREIWDWLIKNADHLGIQSVIWNRRVWGFGRWSERDYNGKSPHTDHVHTGQNKAKARSLTRAQIEAVAPEQEDDLTPEQAKQLDYIYKVLSQNAGDTKDDSFRDLRKWFMPAIQETRDRLRRAGVGDSPKDG